MRKICITTSNFMNWGTEPDAFAKMREFGFEACDYSPLANIHGDIYKLSRSEWVETFTTVRKNAEKEGIEIYQTHGPWVWPHGNETVEGRALWMERMRADLDACEILGCPHLVVHPIMSCGWSSESDEESYHRINREFWETILPDAEKHGVKLLLENMPFTKQSLSRCEPMREFVESFHTDYFQMCLDTGHGLVFGEHPGDCVRTTGSLLKAFHIHDNDGKSDRHDTPYLGIGNWADFKEALKDVDESVPLSLECGPKGLKGELRDDYLRLLDKIALELAGR